MKTRCLMIGALLLILLTACAGPKIKLFTDAAEPLREYTLEGDGKDKILLISVQGTISDSPDKGLLRSSPSIVQQVVSQLKKAEQDPTIKVVLFKVNSPGGTITGSDLLYHEITSFKERTGKKIVVSLMDLAASGAYYLSLPADLIMAHPTTVTGSVGVIFLRPNVRGLMDKIGLNVDVKKFGRNKDMGSPFRESTEEEEKLMQQVVNDLGERFLGLVQKHRKPAAQALAEISTARVFLANEALTLGLVDKIGYLSDAVKESKSLAGLAGDARVVVYRRVEFPEDNYYNTAGVAAESLSLSAITVNLPESLALPAGFYYLWPGVIGTER